MGKIAVIIEQLEKAKYTKRTGTPGNYKYEYGESQGKTSGYKEGSKVRSKQGGTYTIIGKREDGKWKLKGGYNQAVTEYKTDKELEKEFDKVDKKGKKPPMGVGDVVHDNNMKYGKIISTNENQMRVEFEDGNTFDMHHESLTKVPESALKEEKEEKLLEHAEKYWMTKINEKTKVSQEAWMDRLNLDKKDRKRLKEIIKEIKTD